MHPSQYMLGISCAEGFSGNASFLLQIQVADNNCINLEEGMHTIAQLRTLHDSQLVRDSHSRNMSMIANASSIDRQYLR